ncbi:lipocalin family protein [Nocardia neocaledoniensis]|uniref:lipocalin family protein n=1 Tax=Nocardia neocaledoniensis TaxID=236511 RepID=UPI002457A667|nr:lipocalin family protein [Nocardia neocaledoniensis]
MRTRRLPRTTALFAALAAGLLGAGTANAAPPAPVPALDLDRYLGEWRQLAAIPQVFNLDCARDTTATYTLDAQGDIGVYNRCRTWAGGTSEIRGTATVNDPVTNAQLHVSFPGVPGQDERAGATNYIVTALGPDYEWALVTSPSRLSGFVLARTPSLDEATWQRIDEAIRTAGQDPCVYLVSPTTGGRTDLRPLCAR